SRATSSTSTAEQLRSAIRSARLARGWLCTPRLSSRAAAAVVPRSRSAAEAVRAKRCFSNADTRMLSAGTCPADSIRCCLLRRIGAQHLESGAVLRLVDVAVGVPLRERLLGAVSRGVLSVPASHGVTATAEDKREQQGERGDP